MWLFLLYVILDLFLRISIMKLIVDFPFWNNICYASADLFLSIQDGVKEMQNMMSLLAGHTGRKVVSCKLVVHFCFCLSV